MDTIAIAVDVGNRKVKYRHNGGQMVVTDSLVRRPTTTSESLNGVNPLRPFVYLDGPAAIDADESGKLRRGAFLIGADALRGGSIDLATIGSARHRMASDAYRLLHLASIADSLPPRITHEQVGRTRKPKALVEADLLFAGGLPAADMGEKPALLAWLKGEGRKTVHHFTYGDVEYRLRVVQSLIIEQHVAAACSIMFTEAGNPMANGAMLTKRLILDSGGGTTDFGGTEGLKVVPGTEGNMRQGAVDIANRARELIQTRLPDLQVSTLDVLMAMDQEKPSVYRRGKLVSIVEELDRAGDEVGASVVAAVIPQWSAHLSQSEVVLAGGNAAHIERAVRAAWDNLTQVTMLERPIFRIAEGLERLMRHKIQAATRV